MSSPRPPLLRLLYWRAAVLAAACLVAAYLAAHLADAYAANQAAQDEMQQETDWIASLWTENTRPKDMADNWAMSHDTVRLRVRDRAGRIAADSRPELPPPGAAGSFGPLISTAPIPGGELVLSRPGRPALPHHPGPLLLLVLLGGAAGLTSIPLARALAAEIGRLADFIGRIGDDRPGTTIEPPPQYELALLARALNDMSLRRRDADLRQRQSVTDLAHQLRVPAARLRALAEAAARQPAEARNRLDQMGREIAALDRLVGDVEEISRLEEGRAALALVPHSARAWAADLFARLRPVVEAAGIAFSSSLSEIDAEIRIDPERLAQAVGNLLDNAIRAVGSCRSPRIALALEVGLAEWSILVTDNGGGIPEEEIPHVFERFYRLDVGAARPGGGPGLGLPIAKAIAEAHGGRIVIESLPAHGTTVRLAIRR